MRNYTDPEVYLILEGLSLKFDSAIASMGDNPALDFLERFRDAVAYWEPAPNDQTPYSELARRLVDIILDYPELTKRLGISSSQTESVVFRQTVNQKPSVDPEEDAKYRLRIRNSIYTLVDQGNKTEVEIKRKNGRND